jgi:hypothetical protein
MRIEYSELRELSTANYADKRIRHTRVQRITRISELDSSEYNELRELSTTNYADKRIEYNLLIVWIEYSELRELSTANYADKRIRHTRVQRITRISELGIPEYNETPWRNAYIVPKRIKFHRLMIILL